MLSCRPCVFYDHFFFDEALKKNILELVAVRKKHGINAKSEVRATNELQVVSSWLCGCARSMASTPRASWAPICGQRFDLHCNDLHCKV